MFNMLGPLGLMPHADHLDEVVPVCLKATSTVPAASSYVQWRKQFKAGRSLQLAYCLLEKLWLRQVWADDEAKKETSSRHANRTIFLVFSMFGDDWMSQKFKFVSQDKLVS